MKTLNLVILIFGASLSNISQAQNQLSNCGTLPSLTTPVLSEEIGTGISGSNGQPASAENSSTKRDVQLLCSLNGFVPDTAQPNYIPLVVPRDLYTPLSCPSGHQSGEEHGEDGSDREHHGEGNGSNAIPEPSTYAVFIGLSALGLSVWRRAGRR